MKFTGDSSKKSNTLKRTIKGTIKGLKIKKERIFTIKTLLIDFGETAKAHHR